jgi:hypothetical protein
VRIDFLSVNAFLANFFFFFLFFSDQATLSSVLQVNVWQRPQSKKKSRKRNLVASGSHCLGGLLKRQKHERSKIPFCHFLFNGSWRF